MAERTAGVPGGRPQRRAGGRRTVVAAAALFAVLLAALLAAGATDAAAEDAIRTPPNAIVARNFEVIAFGREYETTGWPRVRKWRDPIRIAIVTPGYPVPSRMSSDYPDYFETWVRKQIDDLKALTGHPIELYFSPKSLAAAGGTLPKGFNINRANMFLYYMPTSELPKMAAPWFGNDESRVVRMIEISTCFAHFKSKADAITLAMVAFPAEHPAPIMRACVVEELTQLLGLPNDSDSVNPSIFNDHSRFVELTEHDRLLLRILYDKRMTVGLPRFEAGKLARQILEEIRPGR